MADQEKLAFQHHPCNIRVVYWIIKQSLHVV